MTPTLFDESGKQVRLDTRIGKGGEGEVYLINGADLVVKYYTLQNPGTREQKVREMLANDLADKYPLVAFPRALVFDRARRFVGFTMSKIVSHKPLHELYAPGARKAEFPQANYRFLVLSAANIARAIGSANTSGCVVGDINHSGILVSAKATITLIDADSFQIASGNAVLPCVVGVPEYTPPELQGKTLANVVRTENHDAFGLAIAVFLLLFMGRHPFSGMYSGGDMPLERAIREFRFAYSLKRSVGMSPPVGVPTLHDFPPAIAQAFEVAFGPEGIRARPTPRDWIGLLDELKDRLRVCSASSLHQYPPNAPDCPWCRMEKRFLVPLFLPHISAADAASIRGPVVGDIDAIWRAIEAIPAPVLRPFPQYSGPALQPSPAVQAAGQKRLVKKLFGWGLAAGAVGLGIYAPENLILALLAGGGAWFVLRSKSDTDVELANSYRTVQTRIYQAEADWDQFSSRNGFSELKAELVRKKQEYVSLPRELNDRLSEYARNRRAIQLNQYLSRQLIRNYQIPKIGTGRRAVLLSYGIETAADIREGAILNVPGFGPKTGEPLLAWRRGLESRFNYNPAQTPEDNTATGIIRAEISQKAAKLKAEMAMGPAHLAQLSAAIPNKQAANAGFIEMLLKQRAQVEADLKAMHMGTPQVERPAKRAIQPAIGTQRALQPQPPTATPNLVRCPSCGGNMVIRRAARGRHHGKQFYGCTRYPMCKGTRPFP